VEEAGGPGAPAAAEILSQLNDPKVWRDSDGLVVRARSTDGLITEAGKCAAALAFIAHYPMASEKRPSWLGTEFGNERYAWENMPSVRPARPNSSKN
jgi:hypothetical protein